LEPYRITLLLMKHIYSPLSTFAIAISLFCGVSSTALAADPFPPRKPGLWEMGINPGEGIPPQKISQCIDKDTDAKLQENVMSGPGASGAEKCSKHEFKAVAGGYKMHSECQFAGTTAISDGTFTGDFNSEYKADISITYAPPIFGQASGKVTMSGKWVGECPANMKPGDMKMANGKIVNLIALQQKFAGAAQLLENPTTRNALKDAVKGIDPKQLEALAKGLGGAGQK
jgi:hypothetical protein